jgi:queuine tRNA-ribosyltransferase accessory subunit
VGILTFPKHPMLTRAYSLRPVIEKQINRAPIFNTPATEDESPLRKYIAAQDDVFTILGPRRVPALPCPGQNTNTGISICTSVGFSQLGAKEYHNAIRKLRPDVAITMADVITSEAASLKRVEKSADRTHAWLRDAVEDIGIHHSSSKSTAIFAAIPPVDNIQQSLYLQDLTDEFRSALSGLAVYTSRTVTDLPRGLSDLPRICLSPPQSPHAVLEEISRGIDLLPIPFVASSSDHGIALTFDFPTPKSTKDALQPLGVDLWTAGHETSLSPLSPDCSCFTCSRHHMAYVHHLLEVKEMLAWTLLQLHNHAIVDRFFEGIRKSISQGTFEVDVETFSRTYEADLPARTGLGPRIRGYQTKSVGGGEARKNAKSWGKLDDAAQKIAEADSGIATPDGDSSELDIHGFAEKVCPVRMA